MKVQIEVIRLSDSKLVYGNFGEESVLSQFQDQIKELKYDNPAEYNTIIEYIDDSIADIELKRRREYNAIDDLLKEALVEKELGNDTKWLEYISLRQDIKNKYPKG